MKPISIQLYTVRNVVKESSIQAVLEKIASYGYAAVEGAGFGLTPTEFRSLVEGLGMKVSSYFGPFPTPENVNEFIETAQALGVRHTVSGGWIPEFETVDAIRRTADRIDEVLPQFDAAGLTFSLHNHWMEFEMRDGRLAMDYLVEASAVGLELDIYWASNFGANRAAEMVARYKDRIHLMHVKDGPLVKDAAMTALGEGKVDVRAAIEAANPHLLEWLIVELDECDTDMMEAVHRSYQYLVREGLGQGTKPA